MCHLKNGYKLFKAVGKLQASQVLYSMSVCLISVLNIQESMPTGLFDIYYTVLSFWEWIVSFGAIPGC